MKALVVIAAIAGAIRLATVVDPATTAVVVGVLVLIATGYGLWSNGRSHWHGWLTSWGLIGLGLVGNVLGSILEGGNAGNFAKPGLVPLSFTLGGETLAIAGLLLLLHHRLPGRSAESLATATVSIMALMVPLLALVVTPAIGWHPGTELSTMAVPLLALVMLWLGGSIASLSSRNPVAYRYLIAGFACLFAAHAAAASLFLAGIKWSPVPLSAVVLWSLCLWSCAVLHPSQRQALAPIPFRSSRPGWAQISMIVVAALIAPAVLAAKAMLHAPGSVALLAASAAVLPILVVMYLLYQVFARSAAEYRAQHDPLTGVCNRVLFNDNLEAALLDADRAVDGSVAVMFLDLDRFKTINDSLGHAIGNQVLQAVVQRLQSRLRPTDILARMGGDEFTILMREVSGKANAANFAERILGAFVEPFNVGGKLMPVQTSIGVAMYPEDGSDGETLLKNADTAMYQAKAAGRNTYTVYNSTMSARAELRFVLENSLRGALDRGQLAVHYQPKFSTVGAQIKGVEALARWHHPRLGFIPPSAFIPLAEETSLISSLGEWVLESACLQAKAWQESGIADLPVAVNISPRQFVRQSVVRMVDGVLRRTGLEPTLLELEVTESVLIEHVHDTATSLAELRSMGVRCSIDDFGTGYSALTYLTDMPVDAIKIDPSFVRKIDSETGAAPIVGAVIALAHSLGLAVVAEGVETETQLNFLAEHGCDMVQGYLFSAPVPADQIPAFVSDPPELLVAEWSNLKASLPFGSPLLSPTKLAAILAGVSPSGIWPDELDRDDFMAVLAALQDDDIIPIVGPRGLRLVPARMAIGTLAGLASLTGGLSAAGELPGPLQRVATEILQQATGIVPPPVPSDGRSSTMLLADPTVAQIQGHLVVSKVQSPVDHNSNGTPKGDSLVRIDSPGGDLIVPIDYGSIGSSTSSPVGSPESGTSATGGDVGGTSGGTGSTSKAGGNGSATPPSGGGTTTSTGTGSGGGTTGGSTTGGTTGGGSGSGAGNHSPGNSGNGSGNSGSGNTGSGNTGSGNTGSGNTGSGNGGATNSPGNSGNAPGHTGNAGPGNSGNAPGNSGNTGSGNGGNAGSGNGGATNSPGNSGNAPGHTSNTGSGNGGATNSPGNSGNAPGHTGNPGPGNGGNTGSGNGGNAGSGNGGNAGSGNSGSGNSGSGNSGSGNSGSGNTGSGNLGNTGSGNSGSGNSGSGNSGSANGGNAGNSGNAPGHTGNTGNSGSANGGNTGNSGNAGSGNGGSGNTGAPGNSGNPGSGNGGATNSPGNSGNAPGHTGNPGPGNSGSAPGHTGNTGSSNSGSGNSGSGNSGSGNTGSGNTGSGNGGATNSPGNSGNAPGHTGNTGPGNTGSGNGGSGNTGAPGNSGNAPGHTGNTGPGNSGITGSGNSGNAPGHTSNTGSGSGGATNSPGNGGNAGSGNGGNTGSGNGGNTGSGNGGNAGSGNGGATNGGSGGSGNTGAPGNSGNTGSGSTNPGNSGHSGDPGNSGNAPGDTHSHGRF